MFDKKKKKGKAAEPEAQTRVPAKVSGPTMLERGVPTLKDMMAPPSFNRDAFDHLGVGDRVMRSFLLAGFPKHIQVGWEIGRAHV